MPAIAPRPATTIVLLRDTAGRPEVFLVQRHGKSGFFPNAWVFPGGRVDPGDALAEHAAIRGGAATVAALPVPRADAIAFLVAGVRETFEECGIWLGEHAPPAVSRAALTRNECSFGDLLGLHRSVVDLDRLVEWAHWVTPEVEPRRFDTRFFVARADGATGLHDNHETVDSGWFAPRDVLTASDRFSLAPPTWWTLRELAAFPSVAAILDAARSRPQAPIQPIVAAVPGGMRLLLPGHADHPAPAMRGVPTEITFSDGRWVARSDDRVLPALPPNS